MIEEVKAYKASDGSLWAQPESAASRNLLTALNELLREDDGKSTQWTAYADFALRRLFDLCIQRSDKVAEILAEYQRARDK